MIGFRKHGRAATSSIICRGAVALGTLCLLATTAVADESDWAFTGSFGTMTHIAPLDEADSYEGVARLSDGRRVAVGTTRHQPFSLLGFANKNHNFAVALYGVDGVLDPDFYPCTPLLPVFACPTTGTAQFGFQSFVSGLFPPLSTTYSDDRAYDVVVRSGATDSVGDDAIFVVGTSVLGAADPVGVILKLDPDGTLDTGFDGDGYLLLSVDGMATDIRAAGVQSDGKLIVAGSRGTAGVGRDFFVARINDDGSLDASFGVGGIRVANFGGGTCSFAYDLAVGADTPASGYDDYIVVVGDSMDCAETRGHVAIARFRPDGDLDNDFVIIGLPFPIFHFGFSGDGLHVEEFGIIQSSAHAVVIEAAGSIVIAGFMYSTANAGGLLARFGQTGGLADWDEVLPVPDFSQPYAGTTFEGLLEITGGHFAVTGSAKGGTSGNAFFVHAAKPDLTPLSAVIGLVNLFPANAGSGSDIIALGTGAAFVGTASGQAAIHQATWETCGNGVIEFDEECESGGCCEDCQLLGGGTTCRVSAGTCDAAEVCDGLAPECPVDDVLPNGTLCRVSAGVCDIEETCDGVDVDCPANGFELAATVCRGSAGSCDVTENCTGASANCPIDGFELAATVCRASAGSCDIQENCTGVSPVCPADALEAGGTICRGMAGVCDVAESCSGVNPNCPGDGFEPAATVCRASAGVCDVQENCSGAGAACPANGFLSAATVCRASADVCDVQESCTGSSAPCPADAFEPFPTSCRAAVDLCDSEEFCDGAATSCPADDVEPAGTLCRAGVDECDTDETCDGFVTACPADAFEPAGTPAPTLCDDGEACTADLCDGSGGCDNSGAVSSSGIDYNEDGVVDAADDVDTDSDGIVDACDICISDCNPDQLDTDTDCSGAAAPWTISTIPECGDVCDVCPSSDEAALALDPSCATFDYNASNDCCEEVGAGVSVSATGESCGGAAGNVNFTATGGNSSAAVQIPPGAVADDTSFAADSVDKSVDEFFVRAGGGRYVGGWDFSPEGVTFAQPVMVCMWWNDLNNNGTLEVSEGYDFPITEANIAPYHVDTVLGEFKLADKCSLVPCASFDADGFVDDWGGNTRYDEVSTPLVDESTLGACCGAMENKYCFEVYHFSTYAVGDPNCLSENLDRNRLKVVKLHKEMGEQKVVFSTEFLVPVDQTTGDPDPAIDPIANGFQISLLDSDTEEPTLWSAKVEGGAFDKGTRSGWKVNGKGTKYTYKARDRADGIIKVVVQKVYNKEPGLVKVKVVAARAAVPVDSSVVQAEISLDPAGFLDRCAMTNFETPPGSEGGFCVLNGSGTAIICR